jgi:hypothetical protein
MLAGILVVLEFLAGIALKMNPGEIFTLSVVLPVTLIVMVRWGAWGIPFGALGGLAYTLVNGGSGTVIFIYSVGNLGIALALLVARKIPGEKLRRSIPCIALYTAAGYVGMCLGRSILALIFEQVNFFAALQRYVSVEALNFVMAVIVLVIAARQNGVLEEQISYLQRIAKEEEEKNAK